MTSLPHEMSAASDAQQPYSLAKPTRPSTPSRLPGTMKAPLLGYLLCKMPHPLAFPNERPFNQTAPASSEVRLVRPAGISDVWRCSRAAPRLQGGLLLGRR